MKKTAKQCTNEYEHEAWANDQYLLGIDEAGRGPLAGPLTVAGVIFPIGYENPAIYDSKALSEKKREALFDIIKEDALWFEIRIVSEKDIDTYDIYHADQMAMAAIVENAPEAIVVTDCMPLDNLFSGQRRSEVAQRGSRIDPCQSHKGQDHEGIRSDLSRIRLCP